VRWAGHVARTGKKNAYTIFVGESEGKRPLGRPRRRWENNVKIDLREIGRGGMDWSNLAPDRDQCEHGNEPSVSITFWELLE
jgi:hypothetical protein